MYCKIKYNMLLYLYEINIFFGGNMIGHKNNHIIFKILGIKFSFKYKTFYNYTDSHHIFNINGIKISIRHTKKTDVAIKQLNKRLEIICHKLSLKNDIALCQNVRFYVPNYPCDYIQREIVENNRFYEEDLLKFLDNYIPNNAIIFDIGANIGNHSMYWAVKRNAEKIYAFEPVNETFNTLCKNIEINNLEKIITPMNIGLSNEHSNAEIIFYDYTNIGGTGLRQTNAGNLGIKLEALDSLDLSLDRIDFMKIDVEGHEVKTLKGSINTIKKFKPTIFIESIDPHFNEVKEIMKDLGYHLEKSLINSNYLFTAI